MAIKVVFPTGTNVVSVSGLFQWDYGQVLEIEAPGIGSEIKEVHFACANMKEAIVRPISFSNSVGTVTIPDQCLEQSTPITAWLYRIVGTQGHTEKVINLLVTARTRPSIARDIPQEVSNRYTELITEINEAVENLESGNVTAALAKNATNAGYASSAGNASSASYATSAGSATNASTATYANYAGSAKTAEVAEYLDTNRGYTELIDYEDIPTSILGGLISFKIENSMGEANVIVDVCGICYSQAFILPVLGVEGLEQKTCRLRFAHDDGVPGRYYVFVEFITDGEISNYSLNRTIYYKYLSDRYPAG